MKGMEILSTANFYPFLLLGNSSCDAYEPEILSDSQRRDDIPILISSCDALRTGSVGRAIRQPYSKPIS